MLRILNRLSPPVSVIFTKRQYLTQSVYESIVMSTTTLSLSLHLLHHTILVTE